MKLRALLALAIAALAMALFGPATQASAYPASVCSTLSVSTTNPNVGESITVTGTGFLPSSSVKLILRSVSNHSEVYTLKTVTSDTAGKFTTTVKMPSATTNGGHYDIIATTGYDTQGGACPADPYQELTIGVASTSSSTSTGSSNGGGTAFTGVNVLLMLVVAGGLLVTGVAFNRRGSAKRSV